MAPLFGSPGLYNCIEQYAKLRYGPPLWKLGTRFYHTVGLFCAFLLGLHPRLGKKSDSISVKTFFFSLHLSLGEKSDCFWMEQFLIQIFVLLKFSELPAPLPFSKSCVRYCVYHTWRRLHTVPLIAERKAGKL